MTLIYCNGNKVKKKKIYIYMDDESSIEKKSEF